jgi:hypothetical protein
MHGQSPRSLDEKLVDKEQSYWCLKFGDIKGETESTIVAAQDEASAQTTLREKFWKKKLKVDADYVKKTKKLSTTKHQDTPFWQRMNTK